MRSASTAASIERGEVVRRRVGQRGGRLAVVALEPLGVAEALDRERQVSSGGAPALGELPRGVGVGEEVAVGVDAGRARLEGGGLGAHALELGEHLGVLPAGGAVVGLAQLLVEGLELGAHRGGGLLLGRAPPRAAR